MSRGTVHVVIAVLVGTLIGGGVSTLIFLRLLRVQADAASTLYLRLESQAAMAQYRSGPPDVAIHALEHFIEVLRSCGADDESVRNNRLGDDLAVAYARLGILAERSGQEARGREAYTRSLAILKRRDAALHSADDLRRWIDRLDRRGAAEP